MKYIYDLVSAMQEKRLVLFLGSGFSKECNFPDWKELAEPIAEELDYELTDETDYSLLFQYYQDKNKNRNRLNNLFRDTFYSYPSNLPNHELLAKLPVTEFWTTNYDKTIEDSLKRSNRKVDVKTSVESLSMSLSGSDCTVYKMHGDLCTPEKCILTKDDYEKYEDTHEPFINILKRTFIEKTILFVGYSFNDQDLRAILATIRKYYNNNFSTHYWITKKELNYQTRVKQELFENNLLNYGIVTIEIDDFSEITGLLEQLYLQSRMNSVFISGASIDSDANTENEKRHTFITQLSAGLIKNDLKIINGYGLGVGSSVVEGAYAEIYHNSAFSDSSKFIKLYPFYQSQITSKDADREAFKENYRNEMLRQVGFAIFIYGTKLVNGNIVDSTGSEDEFRIAKENKVFIIPVGSTGGMSKTLWKKVFDNPDMYGYNTEELRDLLQNLNTIIPSENYNEELLSTIFKIIELKRREVDAK